VVPSAAALYLEDMYVDYNLAQETAQHVSIAGVGGWVAGWRVGGTGGWVGGAGRRRVLKHRALQSDASPPGASPSQPSCTPLLTHRPHTSPLMPTPTPPSGLRHAPVGD